MMSYFTVVLISLTLMTIDATVFGNRVEDLFDACKKDMSQYCNTIELNIQECGRLAITHYHPLDSNIPEHIHKYMLNYILPNTIAPDRQIPPPATFCNKHEELYKPLTHIMVSFHSEMITQITKRLHEGETLENRCLTDLSDFPNEKRDIIRYAITNKIVDVEKPESFTEMYLGYISRKVYVNSFFDEIIGIPWPERFCRLYSTSSPIYKNLKLEY